MATSSTIGSFIRNDFRTLMELDQRLTDLVKGKRDFECPDIDHRLDGKAYKANSIEREFTKKAGHLAMYNFLAYTAIGSITGYALAMGRPQSKLISVSLGAIVGSTFGVSKATIGIMRRQIDLPNSPVALESRYQLYKIDPDHQWLQSYTNDIKRWNNMAYYGGITDASVNHNENVNVTMDNNNQNTDNDNEITDDFQHIQNQTQKRQRFYQNRKMLGHNNDSSQVDEHHNDHLYDYERENRTKRQIKKNRNTNDEHDDNFFQFQPSQNDKEFIQTNDNIRWG